MVKTIGGLLYRVNNYDQAYSWDGLLVDEVCYEELVERVEKAEKFIKEHGI